MAKKISLLGFFVFSLLISGCAKKENVKVKLQTTMGDIVIEMQSQAAPNTVKNFLNYVDSGFYNGIIFHRVIEGFMIQTGGFDTQMQQKRPNPPIKNEFKISNTRGTVAMAKIGNDPDSATCQFFISIGDNSQNLDNQNGGFTVFGKVVEGMDIVDKIAAVKVANVLNPRTNSVMEAFPAEPVIINSASVVSK